MIEKLLDRQDVFPIQPTGSRKFTWQVPGYRLNSRNHADQHVTFDKDDHFAKAQCNSAVLLKKRTPPWNTVTMYIVLFCRNNVKQNRLEKQNFQKKERQMYKCFEPYVSRETVRVVIRWHFLRPGAPHKLNYEFKSQTWFAAHVSSRLFLGWNDTRERRKSSLVSSTSGQDESNPVLWLAAPAGKMQLSCPLRTTCCVPQETFPKSHVIIIYWPSLLGQDGWILASIFFFLQVYGPLHVYPAILTSPMVNNPYSLHVHLHHYQ